MNITDSKFHFPMISSSDVVMGEQKQNESLELPGLKANFTHNHTILSLEWDEGQTFCPEAMEQLKGLECEIEFCLKGDIYSTSSDEAAHFFSNFGPRIKRLTITGGIWSAPINDSAVIKTLQYCPNLEKVDCSWCDGITGKFISSLPSSLKELQIRTCRTLQENNLSALKSCQNLEVLHLQNYISREDGWFGLELPQFTGGFLADLPKSLRSLILIQFDFRENQLCALETLENLEHLTVHLCPDWKGAFLAYLNKDLKSLDLSGCNIQKENLQVLVGFKKLGSFRYPKALSKAKEELAREMPGCTFVEGKW